MVKRDAVVITGLGFMTPLGDSIEEVSKAIKGGNSCAVPLAADSYDTMPASFGGIVSPETLASYELCPIKFKMFKPYLKYGVVAAQNALLDAGLLEGKNFDPRYAEKDRGVFVCQGVNGDNAEGLFEAFTEASNPDGTLDVQKFAGDGICVVHPKWMLPSISNNLIFFLTAEFGLRGDNNNVTYSAVGGSYMLEAAYHSLMRGSCDLAVVAASDSILNWQAMDDIAKSGLLCEEGTGPGSQKMLPYSKDAVGALPSEGAACLVLEREEAAKARGAKIYGRLVDTWQHCSADDVLFPKKDGSEIAEVTNHLLGSVPKGSSTMICLNGMSEKAYDEAELNGLKKAIEGRGTEGLCCTSLKHLFCHTFSASFVVELAGAVLALNNEFVPPLPCKPNSPDFDETLFCTDRVEKSNQYALVLSQGLGGNTGGVLIERV